MIGPHPTVTKKSPKRTNVAREKLNLPRSGLLEPSDARKSPVGRDFES